MKEQIKTYAQAEAFLNDVPRFTKKNPMEETRGFYEYIQTPEIGFGEERLGKIIHVAGTNGKGSVCAFMESIYRESGYHVGMFTSPHLITTRERFKIDGESVSEEAFMEAFFWLEDTISSYHRLQSQHSQILQDKESMYQPTYFERLFFMMIYLFAKANVEISILETGLGGRMDTTNVITHPVLSIITEIGLDHMAYLGDTMEAIAEEKAGIIKPGVPLVFIDRKKETSDIFTRKVKEVQTCCHKVSKNEYKINEIQKKCIDFSVCSRYYDYIRFNINSRAVYQVENVAIAVRAVEVLKETQDLDRVSREAIQAGVSKMRWPGRMEEVIPGVYIDGAHNEDGVEAFVRSVSATGQLKDGQKCFLLFSAVNDKKYDKMIAMLSGLSVVTDFVITRIPGHRGVQIDDLKAQFQIYTDKPIHIFEEIQDAFDFCIRNKGEEDIVYIVGSLYLAGLVEDILTRP